MQIKLHKYFYEFLEKENALEEYLKEINKVLDKSNKEYLIYRQNCLDVFEYNSKIKLVEYTSKLFSWNKSEKGFSWWHDIHNKWIQSLKKSDKINKFINEN